MSYINGYSADVWIEQNHPENGDFIVYWKNIQQNPNGWFDGGVTFDESEGEGLRWKWYYKDGKQHGVSKGWWPNGALKQERTYKDGEYDGLHTLWDENGQKRIEKTYKDGKVDGLYTVWYENGQKERERTFKDGKPDGLWTYWYMNGQKKEGTYKDGEI
jgi:antitoxin component YwqK of YwqJK toxin-antitoxin module